MTQTIEYVVAIKGTQQATSAIALIEKGWQHAGLAASKTSKAFDSVAEGAKNLQAKMAPAAAAISGVGAALGNSTSAVGKFVNAAAQGAAAFGAGGPLGLAIVGATLAIDEYVKATKESEAALGVWRDRLTMVTPTMSATRDIVRDLADEAKRLGVETLNAGKTQYEVAIRTAGIEKAALEAKLANIEASDRLRQAAVNEARSAFESAKLRGRGVDEARERLDEAIAIQAMVSRNAQEYRGQVASLEDSVWKIAEAWMATETATKAAVRAAGSQSAASGSAIFDETSFGNTDIDVDARAREARNEAADRAFDARAKLNADRMNAEIKEQKQAAENAARIMDSIREKDLDKLQESLDNQRQAWKDFGSGFADLGIGMFGPVADAGQQFFDDLITGQEHAAEMMGISLMRTAGDALVGHGINLLGQSVVSAFTPALQPLAAAQAGAGAGLVAVGMGLGAGATAASHTLAGGTIGQPLPDDKATKDKGASPRRMGGDSGGGPLVVNVSYGAGGPLPEDIAREINRVVSSGNRRRGAA